MERGRGHLARPQWHLGASYNTPEITANKNNCLNNWRVMLPLQLNWLAHMVLVRDHVHSLIKIHSTQFPKKNTTNTKKKPTHIVDGPRRKTPKSLNLILQCFRAGYLSRITFCVRGRGCSGFYGWVKINEIIICIVCMRTCTIF